MAGKIKIDDLVNKAKEWVNSTEGKQKLAAAYQRAKSTTDYLQEVRIVDPESLHRPITK